MIFFAEESKQALLAKRKMKDDPRSTTPGPSMILASAILLFGISSSAQPLSAAAFEPQSRQVPATTDSSAAPQAEQPQPTPAKAPITEPKADSTGSTAKPAPPKSAPTKNTHHKKKRASSGCDAPPASSSNSQDNSANATSNGTTQNATTQAAPKPCTPEKIVVRHGGTTEPSIQLAAPGGDQASQKRTATTQMLGITEGNLKKISARQLDSTQQATVAQIRQFIGQSRTALDAGDLERANTLAWKAELLSEDLLKPQQ